MPKKILILYAKSGFLGHKVIADNYATLLTKNGYEVTEGDAFELDGKAEVKSGNQIYFWVIKHFPWIWRTLYFGWLKIPGAHWFKNKVLPTRFSKTQKIILDHNPDLVITTHPVATSVANYLKEKRLCKGKLFTTFSDWHTQPFHVYKNVDKYFVVTPEEKDDVIKLGFQPEQILVPGMLLSEVYYNAPSKHEARQKLNLHQDKKIILLMGGGRGWEIEHAINALAKVASHAQIIIIGGSEERKTEIEKSVSQIKDQELKINGSQNVNFEVTGFVEPSLYFAAADLLISKPGGLTSSQAFLLKLPLFATSPLPGQEDENIKYLLAKEAIFLADNNKNFTEQLENVLNNPESLVKVAQNAYKIAPRNAPQIVLETIKNALYSD